MWLRLHYWRLISSFCLKHKHFAKCSIFPTRTLAQFAQFTVHTLTTPSLFVWSTLAFTNKRVLPLLTFFGMRATLRHFHVLLAFFSYRNISELRMNYCNLAWQRKISVIFLAVIRSFVMITWYFRFYYKICFHSYDRGCTVTKFILITKHLLGYLPYKVHDLLLPT